MSQWLTFTFFCFHTFVLLFLEFLDWFNECIVLSVVFSNSFSVSHRRVFYFKKRNGFNLFVDRFSLTLLLTTL